MSDDLFPEILEATGAPLGAVDLALYAAASGDHNPLHLDEDVARAAGFERPLVHGMLSMALAARLFTDRFGAGSLLALDTRFVGVAMRGDRLCFKAQRGEHDADSARYTLSVATAEGREVVTGSARVRRTAQVRS